LIKPTSKKTGVNLKRVNQITLKMERREMFLSLRMEQGIRDSGKAI
jgi:hypothetical protein